MFYRCRNTLLRALRKELLSKGRCSSSQRILVPNLDEVVLDGLKNNTITPFKHPGMNRPGNAAALDDEMIDTIKIILGDSSTKILLQDSAKYLNYIYTRQPPASKATQLDKSAICYWEVYNKSNVDFCELEGEEYAMEEEKLKQKADKLLASRTYHWTPIEYTEYVVKQHIIERMVPEYAALNKIFYEIFTRCPDFRPHSVFDLCSGVGTVTLAARKYWENSIKEYYNVDSSAAMNYIAKLLLTKGDPEAPLPIQNVYYRQFLPSRSERKYSLSVCAYSLLEFPSTITRLQSLWKLWCKTEDFMVLVERGNATGFQLMVEARDFILQTEKNSKSSTGVHVFAPCPHDLDCPLLRTYDKACRFKAPFERLPIGRTRFIFNEHYTYLVFRRGERPQSDQQWPRVLRAPNRKKNRVMCHLCTKNGKLCSYMFKKRTLGTTYYSFARSAKGGDRLPFSFTECDLSDFEDIEDVEQDLGKEITDPKELEGFSDGESDDEKP